jgi:metal-sulfur cluster biosynthetic enzyme
MTAMARTRTPEAEAIAEQVTERLNSIGDPCSVAVGTPMGLAEMGLVEAVDVDEAGHATIRLRLTSPTCHMIGYFHVEAKKRAAEVDGVSSVSVEADIGLDWDPSMMTAAARTRRLQNLARRGLVRGDVH